ncbi:C2 calcium-dependent domain-containing protein 4D [Varanus komodoensis]|uniref:C2 calcium-dependent domain-containing protein 4D n=1 Tax=Varanus komodoensis TaxID=61221 RepID=UPI001CF7A986|nr:C2 calcium-dependent domain-containing protein 4D [Varanus komodoensis]XP_044305112.1 C2 calcium-dependent domain-containing protein 4D [Varanus komodoensis]KAF7238325.1 C2 calcium-dependent domain-containing protein 4D [Varanus komodoensis]
MFSRKKVPKPWPACPNVLTPDRIPAFFIPPNLTTSQGQRTWRSEGLEGPQAPAQLSKEPPARGGSSEPEKGRPGGRLQSAASMPQLSSPMNFAFLPESPHTRRRESLFHEGRPPHQFCSARCSSSPPARPLSQPVFPLDSDTASSTETSPHGSPLLTRSPYLPCQAYGHHRRKFLCRATHFSAGHRPSSLSAEETSSTDTSPSFPRREPEPQPPWPSATARGPVPHFPLELICCRERLTKEVTLTVSHGGRLRLSSEYLEAQGCLRVRLISAEAFYPPHCDPRHIHCCVSLQLRPGTGTGPRQRSAVVKRSRDPIFNEDFFFEGVSLQELSRRCLRLKVFNKGSGMRRDVVLGKCDVPLDSLLP